MAKRLFAKGLLCCSAMMKRLFYGFFSTAIVAKQKLCTNVIELVNFSSARILHNNLTFTRHESKEERNERVD